MPRQSPHTFEPQYRFTVVIQQQDQSMGQREVLLALLQLRRHDLQKPSLHLEVLDLVGHWRSRMCNLESPHSIQLLSSVLALNCYVPAFQLWSRKMTPLDDLEYLVASWSSWSSCSLMRSWRPFPFRSFLFCICVYLLLLSFWAHRQSPRRPPLIWRYDLSSLSPSLKREFSSICILKFNWLINIVSKQMNVH